MNTNDIFSDITGVTPILLAIVTALLFVAVVFRSKVPFLADDRPLFVALVAVGVLGVSGPGLQVGTYGSLQPAHIGGIGLALVVVAVAAIFLGIPVPLTPGEHTAALSMVAIMFAKIALPFMRSPAA